MTENTGAKKKNSQATAGKNDSPSDAKEKKETIPEREESVLRFWTEQRIFEKTLEQTEQNDPYVFYDGPPFATGLPHHGHLLQGSIKDLIARYQTMRGRFVRREWGWDCHGLPVENLIEKELGFTHKKQIEEFGIENFNKKAKESVLAFDKEWRTIVPRMGRWVDMDHAYKTMDANYSESIWWAFKTLYDKKLIYEGYKAMHICPRCETTLAASEVAQGYKDVKDISVYVEFRLSSEQVIGGEPVGKSTSFLAWTTTPWTLPGNVALAVGKDLEYALIEKKDEGKGQLVRFILAKGLVEKHFKESEYTMVATVKGSDLLGLSYEPIFDDFAKKEDLPNRENGWRVYAADFVTTDTGTGIVHIAPAFGEDDMELGKKMKLPFVQHVSMDGKIKPEMKNFGGLFVKPKSDDDKVRLGTDIAIIRHLQETGSFFAKENLTHSYPHCWRCDWPLLNYAASSWFVNVSALKDRLIEENKEVNWVPENIREGRFGKWLEGARDWAISRSRYWGAPIPVWKCNKCGNSEVIGSVSELASRCGSGNTLFVMRHGEAESNVKGIVTFAPNDPYPLTEKGKVQAKSAGVKLKNEGIDLIVTSPVLRTKETAAIVADALGYPREKIVVDERLGEHRTGDFGGKPLSDHRAFFANELEKFSRPAPGGGETLHAMKTRIGEALYEIDATHRGKKILIVTHEYGVWMLDAVQKGATDVEAAALRRTQGEDYILNGEVRPFPFTPIPHDRSFELDLHRPFIDEQTTYKCSCELGMMTRVPEVFDCWFESGAMPFAQYHYIGDETTKEGKMFMKNFPADFIAEALDQTRGWFYTMLILSIGLFDRSAYRSVITTGLILAEDGQKMSKRLRNYPDPMEIAAKYGADALRFYMVNSPVVRGEELRFAISGVEETVKKITLRLDNVRTFYELFSEGTKISRTTPKSDNVLDRWILARWFETHAEVTHHLDTHELDKAARPITPFIDDLSTWYVRRSRDRFKSDDQQDRDRAVMTTGWILMQTAKLLAPFMPFLAEDLYLRLPIAGKLESVHLESWPEMSVASQSVLEEMEVVRSVVSLALEVRAKEGVKVRQPLATLRSNALTLKGKTELLTIIADEVNVKVVEITEGDTPLWLDCTITPALQEEGNLRDVIRQIQELRKKHGLVPDDTITLAISGDGSLIALIERSLSEIAKAAKVSSVTKEERPDATSIQIEGKQLALSIALAQ